MPFRRTSIDSNQRTGFYSPKRSRVAGARLINIPPDPFFSNVTALLHLNGADGSTTITDSSPSPKTFTATGGLTISTAQSKFSGSSASFNGSTRYIASASNAAFGPDSSDFTVECWLYLNSVPTAIVAIAERWNVNGWFTNIDSLGRLYAGMTNTTTGTRIITDPVSVAANTWIFFAFVKQSNNLYLFKDGVSVGTPVTDMVGTINAVTDTLDIGRDNSNARYFNGFIDEFRITKGTARYVSNFNPPLTQFSDI